MCRRDICGGVVPSVARDRKPSCFAALIGGASECGHLVSWSRMQRKSPYGMATRSLTKHSRIHGAYRMMSSTLVGCRGSSRVIAFTSRPSLRRTAFSPPRTIRPGVPFHVGWFARYSWSYGVDTRSLTKHSRTHGVYLGRVIARCSGPDALTPHLLTT